MLNYRRVITIPNYDPMNRRCFRPLFIASPRGLAHDGAILWTRLGRHGQAVHPDLRGADGWLAVMEYVWLVYHIYRIDTVYIYIL